MLLADKQIRAFVQTHRMIEPFAERSEGVPISYGLSSYGYDFRVANTFRIFKATEPEQLIDPLNFNIDYLEDVEVGYGEKVIIPPNSFALAHTYERFRIPRKILTVCVGKSTYARCGIIVNVTPFEPEWEGYATLEISNTTPQPAAVYAGYGIAQLLFFMGDTVCETSYADKRGKYQNQPAKIIGART